MLVVESGEPPSARPMVVALSWVRGSERRLARLSALVSAPTSENASARPMASVLVGRWVQEWEAAAACEPQATGDCLALRKRRSPWGDLPPDPTRANLDARTMDTVEVGALAAGDSAFGCRQMLGNVWEWTDTVFGPYPGFEPGPYKEYSEPWFGTRRVLRGGAWATRSRMVDNTYRNYFPPERRDVLAGFRTCRAR